MAKKTKRKVSPARTASTTPAVEVAKEAVETAPARSTFSRRTVVPTTQEFNPDYTYVINDLKRIGILAGSFFVILIVLSFIIR